MTEQIEILGLDEMKSGLNAFVQQLVDELRPGFIPLHIYHGMGGVPFTLEKVDLSAKQNGFMVRDG